MKEILKKIDYFGSLSDEAFLEAEHIFRKKQYGPGENILIEGEKSPGIYFVISGTVKVYKSSREGKEQVLKLIGEGDSFNDVTVFNTNVNPASVDAVTSVNLLLMSREDLIGLIFKYPEISLNIIKSMTIKLKYLTDRIEDLSLKHTQQRIAKILLLFEGKKLSQKLIADIAGTAREVVSRAIKDLAAQNMIKADKRNITIVDREKLKKLAG